MTLRCEVPISVHPEKTEHETVSDIEEWILKFPDFKSLNIVMEIINNTSYNLDYLFFVNDDYEMTNYKYSWFAAHYPNYDCGGGEYPVVASCFANEHAIFDIHFGIINNRLNVISIGELCYDDIPYVVVQAMSYKEPVSVIEKITIKAYDGSAFRQISKGTKIIFERMW